MVTPAVPAYRLDMSLEEDVSELISRPVKPFEAARDANPDGWFVALDRDQRDELFLLSLYGLADAAQRIARAVDALKE